MSEQELYALVQQLVSRWKDHYGLYTYYVGYLTADLLVALLTVWRASSPEEFVGLSGKEIRELIDKKTTKLNEQQGIKLSYFPSNNEIDSVMPELIDVLCQYGLSGSDISDSSWNAFMEIPLSKIKTDLKLSCG